MFTGVGTGKWPTPFFSASIIVLTLFLVVGRTSICTSLLELKVDSTFFIMIVWNRNHS